MPEGNGLTGSRLSFEQDEPLATLPKRFRQRPLATEHSFTRESQPRAAAALRFDLSLEFTEPGIVPVFSDIEVADLGDDVLRKSPSPADAPLPVRRRK